jgi:molecular chaperone HscB
MKTDYFAYFGITRQFFPDLGQLRKLFLKKSRAFHPDFYSLSSEEEKATAQKMSGLTNKAFAVLQDFDLRLVHLLELEGQLSGQEQHKLPLEFLLEMMDLNEALMELQLDEDEPKKLLLLQQIEKTAKDLLEQTLPIMQAYDRGEILDLTPIKDYYYKQKYLQRLQQNQERDI